MKVRPIHISLPKATKLDERVFLKISTVIYVCSEKFPTKFLQFWAKEIIILVYFSHKKIFFSYLLPKFLNRCRSLVFAMMLRNFAVVLDHGIILSHIISCPVAIFCVPPAICIIKLIKKTAFEFVNKSKHQYIMWKNLALVSISLFLIHLPQVSHGSSGMAVKVAII